LITLLNATPAEETLLEQSKEDFICTEGAIEIQYTEGVEGIAEGFIESGVRRFYLAEDGVLVLEQSCTTFGHAVFIIPIGPIKYNRYIKWERVHPPSNSNN
jgi:hypothetical protein